MKIVCYYLNEMVQFVICHSHLKLEVYTIYFQNYCDLLTQKVSLKCTSAMISINS